jgi:hypothetical protein
MRRLLSITVFAIASALWACNTAQAETIQLTGGTMQMYFGDKNSAHLIGDGFEVSSPADRGSWPIGPRPGEQVDFSTDVSLSDWGQASINGTQLHGDPSGPAAGRLWITGVIHVVATPFIAPPPSDFTGSFQAAVVLSGFVSGYSSAEAGAPPLFTATVSGKGSSQGTYRVITNGSDRSYLDNCCATVTIGAPQRVFGPATSPCGESVSFPAPCLKPTAAPSDARSRP